MIIFNKLLSQLIKNSREPKFYFHSEKGWGLGSGLGLSLGLGQVQV